MFYGFNNQLRIIDPLDYVLQLGYHIKLNNILTKEVNNVLNTETFKWNILSHQNIKIKINITCTRRMNILTIKT